MAALIHVAVGVLTNASGRVLIARRGADLHQGGLWEFPGGKVESGEDVRQALARELLEELGIRVEASEPLLTVEHDYGDRQILLDVHQVTRWNGEPSGMEGQPLAWVQPFGLCSYEFPVANLTIISYLLERVPRLSQD